MSYVHETRQETSTTRNVSKTNRLNVKMTAQSKKVFSNCISETYSTVDTITKYLTLSLYNFYSTRSFFGLRECFYERTGHSK